jgi:ABC-type Fe3+-hydroxamate transport system substrate-binding protein
VKGQSSKSIPIAEYLYPMPVSTDQMHRQVDVPSTPKRIISIVPSQTELLYDLGVREEVIGITKFCIHPEEWFRTKTRVGGTKKLNIKLIKSLKPDLIIGNKEENDQSQVEELAQNFPVWMSDIRYLHDSYEMINAIGKILNRPVKALRLSDAIGRAFFNFDMRGSRITEKNQTVAYCIWNEPIMVAGNDTFINDMLKRCGFINAFQNKNRYPEISEAALNKVSPTFILLSSEPFPFREKHIEFFKKICPSSKVMLVDGEMFSWYGSRLLKVPSYFTQLHLQIAG